MFEFRRSLPRALAALAILAVPAMASAQEVTLRLHQFLPQQSVVPADILDPWADRIEAASDGRIRIERYPSMQLGGTPPQLYDQAIDGIADIVWTLPGYTPGRFPRVEVFELPFTSADAETTSRALWTLAEEEMLDTDFADTKVLGLWVHGPGVIHSRTRIETLDDLNGVKLRAPTRVATMMFEDMGATAIGMSVPAVPEALSKGVIGATVIPWEVTGALKVPELVSHHTEFGLPAIYTATFVLAMNKARYDSLPEDLRAIIDANSGLEFSAQAGRIQQEADAPQRADAEALGNAIVTVEGDTLEAWRAAAEPTVARWVDEMDDRGIDGSGLRARAEALIEEFSAE